MRAWSLAVAVSDDGIESHHTELADAVGLGNGAGSRIRVRFICWAPPLHSHGGVLAHRPVEEDACNPKNPCHFIDDADGDQFVVRFRIN